MLACDLLYPGLQPYIGTDGTVIKNNGTDSFRLGRSVLLECFSGVAHRSL